MDAHQQSRQRGLIRRRSGDVVAVVTYLAPDVARELKLHVLDTGTSVSAFVARAVQRGLEIERGNASA